jgi:hypothetical protein
LGRQQQQRNQGDASHMIEFVEIAIKLPIYVRDPNENMTCRSKKRTSASEDGTAQHPL